MVRLKPGRHHFDLTKDNYVLLVVLEEQSVSGGVGRCSSATLHE